MCYLILFCFADKVKFITGNILEYDFDYSSLDHIKVVMITAHSSCSGVVDVINFIINEGQGTNKP